MLQHKTNHTRLKVVAIMGLVGWALSSCSGSFVDATEMIHSQLLSSPKGDYTDVAWLADNLFAFEYAPKQSNRFPDYQIAVYTTGMEEWRLLPIPKPDECVAVWNLGHLQRLPNGNLGFVHHCNVEPAGNYKSLYMWDRQTDSLQMLQRYPRLFATADYAFAPDMSELIQEQEIGPWLSNQLYRVSRDGQMEQILSNYQRVKTPDWSLDGHTIAFLGTETYPGGDSSTFTTFGQIADLATYPWDIYLMDADGSNVRLVLSVVTDTGILKWSPQGRLLAFMGTYKDAGGIWLLDVDTSQVTRIWPARAGFDWSPDGRKMVVLPWKSDSQGNREPIQPVIIDVPIDTK